MVQDVPQDALHVQEDVVQDVLAVVELHVEIHVVETVLVVVLEDVPDVLITVQDPAGVPAEEDV